MKNMQTEQQSENQVQQMVYYMMTCRPVRIMGNRVPSITETNRKILFRERTKRVDYKVWKRFYIEDHKPDLSRKVVSEVINGKHIELSIGDILELGETNKYLGENIMRIVMKAAYTGRDCGEQLKGLLVYNIRCGGKHLMNQLLLYEKL